MAVRSPSAGELTKQVLECNLAQALASLHGCAGHARAFAQTQVELAHDAGDGVIAKQGQSDDQPDDLLGGQFAPAN